MTCVAVLVAGGCSVVGPSAQEQARTAATRFAESMAQGQLDQGVLTPDTRERAGRETPTILAGMGERRPQVSVADVPDPGSDGSAVTARVSYSWSIREGLPPWTYVASVPLVRAEEGWQVRWSPAVVVDGLADHQRVRAMRIDARRAEILGGDGRPIVTDREVLRIGIDRGRVDEKTANASARRLAAALKVDVDDYAARVAGSGPKAFVEALVVRWGEEPRDEEDLTAIPGVVVNRDEVPLAPTAGFAAPILGRVGQATAEIVEKSNGRIAAGDVVGLDGLQAAQDERLRGTPGFRIERVAETGFAETIFTADATAGTPLELTLDIDTQRAAEAALATVKPAGAIVAIRPSDGAVLALANGPGSKGYPTATLGLYPPGSTFKTVTALALLRAGVSPSTQTPCTTTSVVDGRAFKNYDNYPSDRLGQIPLRTAFAHSCNTSLIALRDTADQQALADAAASLGLRMPPELGVPAELGSVPAEAEGTDHAASMIGQGQITTSPLGVATMTAGIAAGHPVRPRLVVDAARTEAPQPPTPLTADEARALQDLMRATTTEGSGRFLADLPGPEVLSKTGTAEYGDATPPRSHAWMIAIQGDLAVAVFVEDGAGGARTAGPVLKSFLRQVATQAR